MHILTLLTGITAGLMLTVAYYVPWLWVRYMLIFSSGGYATLAAVDFMR